MSGILRNIWQGIATASPLDQLNLGLGIAGVWLMIRRSLWAFPVGLLAVTVQGVLFWRMHFPADAALQVFYFVMLAWGWRHWSRGGDGGAELPITCLSNRARLVTLGLAGAATALWALTVGKWMGAAMPWRDAFIAWFSVAAQVLQVRKNLENWPLWVLVNLVAVVSYWSVELAFTALLYAIYLRLGILGWVQWRRAMKAAETSRPGAAKRDEGGAAPVRP